MGERIREALKLRFDERLRLECHGARITSHAGLLACRELDGALLQMGGQPVLFRSEPKAPCEKRWRKADIDRFLAGDDPDPGQTFLRLLDMVRKT